jgi:hypothetical protein
MQGGAATRKEGKAALEDGMIPAGVLPRLIAHPGPA